MGARARVGIRLLFEGVSMSIEAAPPALILQRTDRIVMDFEKARGLFRWMTMWLSCTCFSCLSGMDRLAVWEGSV